jgi:hypothetical protein
MHTRIISNSLAMAELREKQNYLINNYTCRMARSLIKTMSFSDIRAIRAGCNQISRAESQSIEVERP